MHPFNKLHDEKNLALTDNYGDLITFIAQKLDEPIPKQYLKTCPKNATYLSNTTAKSMVDAMNFYFKSKSLAEINKCKFITLYADEAENSSHKECFAMFVTYYFNKAQTVVTSFLGILNLKGKTAAKKKKKKLYGPFLWIGFNCLKATTTSRRQFTFYQSVHRHSWYSFY